MVQVKKDRVYVLLTRMARAMKVSCGSVYEWEEHGYFETTLVGSQRMILRKDLDPILHDWRRSCTPTKAAKLIGIKQGTISGYMAQGYVDTIKMFGFRRVLLASIPQGKKYADSMPERLHQKSVEMGRNGGGHRWTSEELKKVWEKKRLKDKSSVPSVISVDCIPETTVDLDEACRIMGMIGSEVLTLFYNGHLAGSRVDGKCVFPRKEIGASARIYNRPTALHRLTG